MALDMNLKTSYKIRVFTKSYPTYIYISHSKRLFDGMDPKVFLALLFPEKFHPAHIALERFFASMNPKVFS